MDPLRADGLDHATAYEPVVLHIGPYRMDTPADSDLADIVAAFRDPDIALWNPPGGPPISVEERAPLWIASRSRWDEHHASWVVRDHDGSVLGQVSLHQLDFDSQDCEVGYWLAPRGRGRGIGTAMVEAATRYAFDELGMFRVELFHAVENEASCRLALRCGYLLEGTARQSYTYGDGQRHDEHLHARLRTDTAPALRAPEG
jgi:RimJ/RimL family protein N-acetyltransferase